MGAAVPPGIVLVLAPVRAAGAVDSGGTSAAITSGYGVPPRWHNQAMMAPKE
jgi:hypothetical protein